MKTANLTVRHELIVIRDCLLKGADRHGDALFFRWSSAKKLIFPQRLPITFSCIFPTNGCTKRICGMIRKYFWLVIFALSVLLLDALIMQWIEFLTTEVDKCRNMDSVNPLKLVNCADLN